MAAGAAKEAAAGGFAEAHRALLADPRVQFDLAPVPPPPPLPSWLQRLRQWLGDLGDWLADTAVMRGIGRALAALGEWLAHAGPLVRIAFWLGVAALVALLLWALWRVARHWWQQRPRAAAATADEWRPEAAPARALLAEADALAARGDYAEAAHLVLLRSVEQIGERRAGLVRPALTSRDIARVEGLPGDVARAFALIAGVVESGLFAARPVGADAWQACRAAYEAVAFPKAWA